MGMKGGSGALDEFSESVADLEVATDAPEVELVHHRFGEKVDVFAAESVLRATGEGAAEARAIGAEGLVAHEATFCGAWEG